MILLQLISEKSFSCSKKKIITIGEHYNIEEQKQKLLQQFIVFFYHASETTQVVKVVV